MCLLYPLLWQKYSLHSSHANDVLLIWWRSKWYLDENFCLQTVQMNSSAWPNFIWAVRNLSVQKLLSQIGHSWRKFPSLSCDSFSCLTKFFFKLKSFSDLVGCLVYQSTVFSWKLLLTQITLENLWRFYLAIFLRQGCFQTLLVTSMHTSYVHLQELSVANFSPADTANKFGGAISIETVLLVFHQISLAYKSRFAEITTLDIHFLLIITLLYCVSSQSTCGGEDFLANATFQGWTTSLVGVSLPGKIIFKLHSACLTNYWRLQVLVTGVWLEVIFPWKC